MKNGADRPLLPGRWLPSLTVTHGFLLCCPFFIGNVLPVLSLLFVRTLSRCVYTPIMCSSLVTAWRLLIDYVTVCMVGGLTEILILIDYVCMDGGWGLD